MKELRRSVRLSGKYLFIYYHKGLSGGDGRIVVNACTNKRILSKRTQIEYNTLMWVFTRKGLCYYENGTTIILKLNIGNVEKGEQSMVRRGKGGMERFRERYMMKKRDEY
jgi:hypothetical protein